MSTLKLPVRRHFIHALCLIACLTFHLVFEGVTVHAQQYTIEFRNDTVPEGDTVYMTVLLQPDSGARPAINSIAYTIFLNHNGQESEVIETEVLSSFLDSGEYTLDYSTQEDTFFLTLSPNETYYLENMVEIIQHIIVIDMLDGKGAPDQSTDAAPMVAEPFGFLLYPNPASGSVAFNTYGMLPQQVELLDPMGSVVRYFAPPNSSRGYLDLRGLSSGIYWVRMVCAEKTMVQQVIVH